MIAFARVARCGLEANGHPRSQQVRRLSP